MVVVGVVGVVDDVSLVVEDVEVVVEGLNEVGEGCSLDVQATIDIPIASTTTPATAMVRAGRRSRCTIPSFIASGGEYRQATNREPVCDLIRQAHRIELDIGHAAGGSGSGRPH